MKLSPFAFGPFVVLLAACGETARPSGQTSNNDVPPVDVPAIDTIVVTDTGNDATVADADATVSDTTPVTDRGGDVTTDTPAADRADAADVQTMIPGLCAWWGTSLQLFIYVC